MRSPPPTPPKPTLWLTRMQNPLSIDPNTSPLDHRGHVHNQCHTQCIPIILDPSIAESTYQLRAIATHDCR